MDNEGDESGYNDEGSSSWTMECETAEARRRRRMQLRLLEREQLEAMQRPDCTNRMGHSPLQKVMAAVRVLGYGCCFDSVDEVIKMGGTSVKRATIEFCETIVNVYKSQYLRDPTPDDISCLLAENKVRGFPRMIGSLDCMHWCWDACPIAWRGQYNGWYGYPTLILEAAASQDLWIWHAFFGMPGSNNDITVLDYSLLFDKYMNGTAPPVEYEVNGTV
ncbi:uncharacterized protein LOC127255508 [Andrographis paniculata]|uniref:uncharacterized protein LOC127255508 n=1 Tax=Andrographis paniculata TaxID=175694 RepID=UPI0021E853E1|nr:uncharacterized protein LOC127255508 [Andrographis paniculata]